MNDAVESRGARWLVWLAVAGLGWFLFRQLSLEWEINPQYSYGWVVPVLAGYLFLERWRDRPGAGAGKIRWGWFWGLLTLVAAVRLFQEANPDWRLLSWVAGFCVVGLGLVFMEAVGGRAWARHFGFAIGFVLVAVPWPTEAENLLVQSLMRGVAGMTVEFLNWAGIAAQQEGNLIRLAGGTLGVDEACSGVRSFQGTIMAALFFGELYRLNVGRRVALLGIGVGMALGLNMVRAMLLAVLAARNGMEAVNRWHDPAGWVLLAGTFFGLLGVGRWLAGKAKDAKKLEAPHVVSYGALERLCLIVMVWVLAAEVGTRAWYWSHERGQVKAARWEAVWEAPKVEISENVRLILRFNDGKAAVWNRPDGSRWHLFFFSWKPGRAAATLARSHRPETCLPSTGFELAANRGVKVHRVAGLDLPVERLDFKSAGKVWRVYYCLWEDRISERATAGPELTRQARLRAVLEGRRHLGQRVLEVVIGGMDSEERADEEFAEALAKWITVDKS